MLFHDYGFIHECMGLYILWILYIAISCEKLQRTFSCENIYNFLVNFNVEINQRLGGGYPFRLIVGPRRERNYQNLYVFEDF